MRTVADIDLTSLTCPIPDCAEVLYVTWSHARPLYVGDLYDNKTIGTGEAYTGSWQVECVQGHVVLLPGGTEHDCEGDCRLDVDHDDENRTFRASDLTRLDLVMKRLSDRASNPSGGDRD